MSEQRPLDEAAAAGSGKTGASGCACMGTGPMISELFRRMGPDETTRAHFRNARIEILKGLRHLIDQRIADLSAARPSKGAKVTID